MKGILERIKFTQRNMFEFNSNLHEFINLTKLNPNGLKFYRMNLHNKYDLWEKDEHLFEQFYLQLK